MTVPLPKDFITTGDAQLEIGGQRRASTDICRSRSRACECKTQSLFEGHRSREAPQRTPRSDVVDAARRRSHRRGSTSLSRAATHSIVKNNIADLTASVSLTLTGDADNPQIAGRITANSGTIFFRKDRYASSAACLNSRPTPASIRSSICRPRSEIAGYQVFVNLSGPLKDSEQLNATVRSSPALPQADVVSLITTGNLANSAGGIPTLAQTRHQHGGRGADRRDHQQPGPKGNRQAFRAQCFRDRPDHRRAQQTNPTARFTVGRQINNNLRVTYSTNLSQDQNQVLAFEYRVSNKLSFVAQYEQRPLSNVTQGKEQFQF